MISVQGRTSTEVIHRCVLYKGCSTGIDVESKPLPPGNGLPPFPVPGRTTITLGFHPELLRIVLPRLSHMVWGPGSTSSRRRVPRVGTRQGTIPTGHPVRTRSLFSLFQPPFSPTSRFTRFLSEGDRPQRQLTVRDLTRQERETKDLLP